MEEQTCLGASTAGRLEGVHGAHIAVTRPRGDGVGVMCRPRAGCVALGSGGVGGSGEVLNTVVKAGFPSVSHLIESRM